MDNFKIHFCSTVKIDIGEDDKYVMIVFEPEKNSESSMIANVYTGFNDYGVVYFQFGLCYNPGDEMKIYDMVIGNIMNDNVTWERGE